MPTRTANAKGGTIILSRGDDIVKLGKGKDVIRTGENHGNNIIYNYDNKNDILETFKDIPLEKEDSTRGYSLVGDDLILRIDKTNITLKGMATKTILAREQGKKVNKYNFSTNISEETDNKVHYAKKGSSYDWTKVVADKNFSGEFLMDEYNENLRIFDGRAAEHVIHAKGGENNDVIYASNYGGGYIWGDNGNDTLYCGNGADKVFYNNDDGNDTIVNFNAKKDMIVIGDDCGYFKSATVDGKDLVVTIGKNRWHEERGNGTLRIKNGATMGGIRLREADDADCEYKGNFHLSKLRLTDKRNGHYKDLAQSVSYSSKTKTLKALTTDVGGTYDLGAFAADALTLDASKLKTKATLVGNDKNNKITAGQAGSKIRGGKGNDTIYLGKGKDTVYINQGDGKDTIYNYDVKNDILSFDQGIDNYAFTGDYGEDLTLYSGKTTVTLKDPDSFEVRYSIKGNTPQTRTFFDNTGLSFKKNDKTTLVASAEFKGYADFSVYDNVKTFDGRAVKKRITIKGAADRNDKIYAGNYGNTIKLDGGNDTVYCGKGKDTIEYQLHKGKDTIVKFNAKKDSIKLTAADSRVTKTAVDGKDLVVTVAQIWERKSSTLCIKDGAAMDGIKVGDTTIAQSVSYNESSKTLTPKITYVGGKYDLGAFAADAITLNARKLDTKATLVGNAQNNKIIAGQQGSDIKGGKGNDTITCGKGADRIWFAASDGKDTVLKSGKNDVAYLYGIKS
ncbi:MAG: hypothetical protein IJU00_12435, partial [Selenomonas sp.]|nr:hypothetical protein [Selenomonas sp.]